LSNNEAMIRLSFGVFFFCFIPFVFLEMVNLGEKLLVCGSVDRGIVVVYFAVAVVIVSCWLCF